MSLDDRVSELLRQATKTHQLRRPSLCPEGMLNFSSNDYLSLRAHPTLKKAHQQAFAAHPVSSAGAMLLSGYHAPHQELEQAFADFLGVEGALLLNSGYVANLSLIAFLQAIDAICLVDKQIHASVYDGLHKNQMSFIRYIHNELSDLEKKLSVTEGFKAVLTEAVFSMSGQRADLGAIRALASAHQATLIVDEAHSFGLYGQQGRGAAHLYGLDEHSLPLRVIPLGKAFAAQGAMIAGKKSWIEALVQVARPYIYSTAPSPAFAAGMLTHLELLKSADDRREKLQCLIASFQDLVGQSRMNWRNSCTAIQFLTLGSTEKALNLSSRLADKGFYCLAVRHPTVRKNEAGLRVVLNYDHEIQHLKQLFHLIERFEHEYSF